jgi:uncharacterized membrane protein HdeD (DUF308 family)
MENTTHQKSSIWYILAGILSIFVGFYAMGRPGLATLAVTQVVGIIALASGLVLFLAAVFGKAGNTGFTIFSRRFCASLSGCSSYPTCSKACSS